MKIAKKENEWKTFIRLQDRVVERHNVSWLKEIPSVKIPFVEISSLSKDVDNHLPNDKEKKKINSKSWIKSTLNVQFSDCFHFNNFYSFEYNGKIKLSVIFFYSFINLYRQAGLGILIRAWPLKFHLIQSSAMHELSMVLGKVFFNWIQFYP